MDTDERSHIFHDVTMAAPGARDSGPRSLAVKVKSFFQSSRGSKRGLTSPEQPSAKQNRSLCPEVQNVSLSLADLCLASPEKLLHVAESSRSLRSRGPAPNVPNINFPVESAAYQRRLAQVPVAAGPAPEDGATEAAPTEPSTVPELGEGHAEQNAAPPRSPGEV